MEKLRFKITGLKPLMLNNPQTVSPFNEFSKKLKPLTSKRTKTEDDLMEISRLKFLASVYYENGQYVLPSEHFEQSLIAASRERKLGKKFERSLFVQDDAVLKFKDANKTPEELYKLDIYVDERCVGIKNVKVTTTRCIIPTWETEVELWYDETQLDEKDITDIFEIAGLRYGVGTYRKKFGKFKVEKVK